jgi:DNA-binding transcriptional ArsR family regulator
MAENLDLLGWPIPEPRDAGRPEHVPTDENRNKIMMLLVFKKTNAEIAKALGLSQPTLRKHYLQQLDQRKLARLQLDATRWAALYAKVLAGDVGAMKELGKVLEAHDRAELAANFGADTHRRREQEPRPVKRGKKEQAQVDAENAGADSDWGDDLLPGTRVN